MAKSQPIKKTSEIELIKNYFLGKSKWRDYTLFVLGINTSLRISDLLSLKWHDVYNFDSKTFKKHLTITEKKTQKKNSIALNNHALGALKTYSLHLPDLFLPEYYIFLNRSNKNVPIKRNRAYNIMRQAAKETGIEGVICCHSLRKTFGYHAWKRGVPSAIIMEIYNHSSMEVTKRYLSIDQDDKDDVFKNLLL